jgi:hypothetical protein
MYEDMLKFLRSVYQDTLNVHIMALQLPEAHFAGSVAKLFVNPAPIAIVCGNGEKEREGCCIEGATASDYTHKRAE